VPYSFPLSHTATRDGSSPNDFVHKKNIEREKSKQKCM